MTGSKVEQLPFEPAGEPLAVDSQELIAGRQLLPGWLRLAGRLTLTMLAIASGNTALQAEPAIAGGGYIEPIQPALTHPHGGGNRGDGAVIANVPYGYYIGRAFPKNEVKETLVTKAKDYAFGAIGQQKNGKPLTLCGWIEAGSLSTPTKQLQGSPPCSERQKVLTNQYSFGHGFNCAPSACDGGTFSTHLTPECDDKIYANDASLTAAIAVTSTSRHAHRARGLYDLLGILDNSKPVHYRFTTNDNKAAVVMSDTYGWGFVDKQCIAGYPQGGGRKQP